MLFILLLLSVYDFVTNVGLLYFADTPFEVFVYSAFTLVEYLLFAAVLHSIIKNKGFKNAIIYVSILFTIFIIIYDLTTKVNGIDSVPIGVETILILGFSFYYLFEQMQDTSDLFVYNRYSFWIVLGMMVYLAGCFFIYIYASQLPSREVAKYWVFTNIFSILKNILFTVAILIHVRNTANKPQTRQPLYTLN